VRNLSVSEGVRDIPISTSTPHSEDGLSKEWDKIKMSRFAETPDESAVASSQRLRKRLEMLPNYPISGMKAGRVPHA
jgi:hypothetical protein